MPTRILRFAFAAAMAAGTVVLSAGCVSSGTNPTAKANSADSEYVYVTETGSRIPRRVKRSQMSPSAATTSATAVSGEEASDRINHMPIPVRPSN